MKKKIMVVGNYGDGNIGDEAILDALLDEIIETNAPPVEIIVPSRNPEKLQELHKNRLRAISPNQIITEFISIDIMIFGGGTLFSRYSGIYIYFSMFLIILSKMSGKLIFFKGIGISDNITLLLRILIKESIGFVDEISTRDVESYSIFKEMGFRKNMCIVPDYGSLIKPVSKECVEQILLKENIDRNEFLVGLSLNYHRDEKINDGMISVIPKIIDWMIDNYDLYIMFYTFCPSFSSDVKRSDKHLGMRLRKNVENKNRFILLEYHMQKDTLGLMGEMDMFIGMRYHSQVFAHKQGIQLIGLAYDDKCRRFLNENRLEGLDISDAIAFPEKFKLLISKRLEKMNCYKYEKNIQ